MRRHLALLIVSVVALSGCFHLTVPEGDAPLRYRDEVFSEVTTTSGVPYASAVDQSDELVVLELDVYEPTGDHVDERPAIVWVHGGGFCCGDRTSPEIVDQAEVFARKGFVGFSISYRLSESGCSASGPTAECVTAIQHAMHDAQSAVRYVRAHADEFAVDASRVAIAGTSAGAITALNVAYGPEDPGPGPHPEESSAVRAAVSLSGARIFGTPDDGDAPTLLFHGSTDVVVPYQWAVNTVDAARAADQYSVLTTWEGEGHVPYVEHRDQILGQTTNFLYWLLDLAHAPR